MKKIMSIIISSTLLAIAIFSISYAGIRSDHGSSGHIIHIFYNTDPLTCIGSGDYDCHVHCDWQESLGISQAEDILNDQLPINAQPVILTRDDTQPDGGWDLQTLGTSVLMGSQYYNGWGPDAQLIEGEMTEGDIYFPAQTIVYSEEYQGFIAYWLDETP